MEDRSHVLSFLLLLILIGCCGIALGSSEKKNKLLSILFDGVAKAGSTAPKKAKPKRTAPESALVAEPVTVAPQPVIEKPRPKIEELKTWEEVLQALPTDILGGPDWVSAIKDGVIAPRAVLPSDPPPIAPFTLDTLVPATVSDTAPALDWSLEIVPQKDPFYKVVFPHSSHTSWLNCSSCHPGMLAQRGSGMRKIFAGEYCGKCHGKVSFAPLNSCARCHVNLKPAAKEAVEADLQKALQHPVATSPELVERGKKLYLQDCAVCHGEKGDGNGPLAEGLDPKPRDFTPAKFKFRSTNSSSLPTDFDIFRTITRGIPGTSMPAFSFISYEDRFAISHFLKTFSDRFARRKPGPPIPIPEPPPKTPELMELGRKLYNDAECNKCHGTKGQGDGPSAATTKDDWEQPLKPADLTSGKAKSGTTLKDYYRTLMTGLKGTPMPDSGEVFEPEQAWAVVYYAYSLGEKNRNIPPAVKGDIFFTRKTQAKPVPSPPPVAGDIRPAAGSSITDDNAPPATFPHWVHRMRLRCAVCHPSIFEMKAQSATITMDGIRAGQYCGKCHPSYPDPKGLVAWPVSFDSCGRCHFDR